MKASLISMLLLHVNNQLYKLNHQMFIRDAALGPTVDTSSALKTLDPDVQTNVILCTFWTFMINMLLVQINNHPYKFVRDMLIRDPAYNPQLVRPTL